MKKWFSYEESDNDYVESACDPDKRKDMLKSLERQRRIYLWIVAAMFISFLASWFLFVPKGRVVEWIWAMYFLLTFIVAYNGSNDRIKMLKILDRMKSSEE